MNHPPPPGTSTYVAYCEACNGEHAHYNFTAVYLAPKFVGAEPGGMRRFTVCTHCGHQLDVTPC